MACGMTNISYDYCIAGFEFNNLFTQMTPLGVQYWVIILPSILGIFLLTWLLSKWGFFDDAKTHEGVKDGK